MKRHPLKTFASRIKRLNHRHVLPDAVIVVACLYASLFLRIDAGEDHQFLPTLNRLVPLFLVIRLATFTLTGVYDIIWRYVSMADVARLFRGIAMSSVLIIATSYLVDIGRLPRAVFFIDSFLLMLFLPGIRFARRLSYQANSERELRAHGRRTVVLGAGVVGRALVARLRTDSTAGMKVVGFIDDDPQKVGRLVSGLKVMGTRADLAEVIRDYGINELVVSTKTVPGEALREVVRVCRSFDIQPHVFTSGLEVSGKLGDTRAIGLGDLLNRPSRTLDVGAIRQLVQGHRVLVTGAGGSIGSELARQILTYGPSELLLLDHSEFNLYNIDQELQAVHAPGTKVISLLADIKERSTLSALFRLHRPQLVIHAAAYKHVHLVETNPFTSILNNVQGTKNLCDLSVEFDVQTFVLISSDKAVNPAGTMGATKRICELLVSEAGRRSGKRFCSVRFGNVLGSSGSLIPKLRQQIEAGGPLTITHKDMTRYFMLIPEAGALVLRAATIAEPGDIAVLRMGEPLKIVDVAHSLVALMGKSPEEIAMVFTGLRPGEKLFEELYLCGNETITEDPDVLIMPKGDLGTWDAGRQDFLGTVNTILDFAQQGSAKSLSLLSELVNSNYTHPPSVTAAFRPNTPAPAAPSVELH